MPATKAKRRAVMPVEYQPTTIKQAIYFLRQARNNLRGCGSKKAADATARAVKSAEGALRHAQGMAAREIAAQTADYDRKRARRRAVEDVPVGLHSVLPQHR